MSDDADQLTRGVAGQTRVGVEREAVFDGRQERGVANFDRECRVARAAKKPVELLDLPAFALPSHPHVFARVPQASAMKQIKTVRVVRTEALVEHRHTSSRGLEQLHVVRHVRGRRVREVAQNREVNISIEIGERKNLNVIGERVNLVQARKNRRDDDHRPRGIRNAVEILDALQALGSHESSDDALNELRRDLAGRKQHQRKNDDQTGDRRAMPVAVPERRADDGRRDDRDRPEI